MIHLWDAFDDMTLFFLLLFFFLLLYFAAFISSVPRCVCDTEIGENIFFFFLLFLRRLSSSLLSYIVCDRSMFSHFARCDRAGNDGSHVHFGISWMSSHIPIDRSIDSFIHHNKHITLIVGSDILIIGVWFCHYGTFQRTRIPCTCDDRWKPYLAIFLAHTHTTSLSHRFDQMFHSHILRVIHRRNGIIWCVCGSAFAAEW